MVRAAQELPHDEGAACRRGATRRRRHRVRDRQDQEEQTARHEVEEPDAHLPVEGEVRDRGAEDEDAGLLGQEREAERRGEREDPDALRRQRVAGEAVEDEGREEHLGTVEQHLPAHDHVVGHDREQGGREESGAPTVEARPERVGEQHRRDAERSRQRARREVGVGHAPDRRDHRLEEQRVRAVDGEVVEEAAGAGDRRRGPGVDRLVTVEAVSVERVQPCERGDDGDRPERQPHDPVASTAVGVGAFGVGDDDRVRVHRRGGGGSGPAQHGVAPRTGAGSRAQMRARPCVTPTSLRPLSCEMPRLAPCPLCPLGTSRSGVAGSVVYERFPGSLPHQMW